MAPRSLNVSVEPLNLRVTQIQQLLVVRLGTLRRIMLRSGGLAYARETGLFDNDWLLISFIGMHDRPVFASEIAVRLLYDKGQVSRVVTRLVDADLLLRDYARGPLRLSKDGQKVFERIQRILRARNTALLRSISDADLAILDKVLDKLFASAQALLEDERRLAPKPSQGDFIAARPGRNGDFWKTDATAAFGPLVMPDLHVLLRLLRHSAKLAYGRVTGLSDFDWLTLSNIAMGAPMTLADLIDALDRNKSQVGRAVNRLIALGLATRRKQRGVASVVVTVTPAGEAAHDAIAAEARRRDERLLAELTVRERATLTSIFDRLTQNALDLLKRERAISARSGVSLERGRGDD